LENDYKLPGHEFAFGWTDLNLLMHAERINKLSSIFLTHLDLLDDLDEIKICTGYRWPDGSVTRSRLPATIREFSQVTAEYEVLKGWKSDTRKVRRFDELPTEA
jgi:adenylosuccinate synthase